jgi:spore coat protein A
VPPVLNPFCDPLPIPSVAQPLSIDGDGIRYYRLAMRNGERKVHRDLPGLTPYWGYEGAYPGPTIEVPVDCKVVVEFVNALVSTVAPQPKLDRPPPELD